MKPLPEVGTTAPDIHLPAPLPAYRTIRKVSKKRSREQRQRIAMLRNTEAAEQPCALCLPGCWQHATDAHEVRTRARGGSITNRTGIVLLCRPCHNVITRESGTDGWAERHGWVVSSWSTKHDEDLAWRIRRIWTHCLLECETDHRGLP